MSEIHDIAAQLLADHKGLLAADESVTSAGKRLGAIHVENTPESRRQYRNLFLTTPGVEQYLSGVIFHEETLGQAADDGTPFVKLLQQKGIIPGIKVDGGTQPLPNYPGELITEGLDGLGERLHAFYQQGARFAKWRAVISIGDGLPTDFCIAANAQAMARYAALCQENNIVPIVEPEVLIDGSHDLATSEVVTTKTLKEVFTQLQIHGVDLSGVILKSSMVISGNACPTQATPDDISAATLRCFKNTVPAEVPGIVFLSGGQSAVQATQNLNAIGKAAHGPWKITFSYARALQGPPLQIWKGKPENVAAAQAEFIKRLAANVAANSGEYAGE
ncbi:MAG: class I fructose-bisphosphate aldolase [Patescibacteria group bacterium]